jgi:hypothetical protein
MLCAICDSIDALNIDDAGEWPWDYHGLITAAGFILESIMDCDLKILTAVRETIKSTL